MSGFIGSKRWLPGFNENKISRFLPNELFPRSPSMEIMKEIIKKKNIYGGLGEASRSSRDSSIEVLGGQREGRKAGLGCWAMWMFSVGVRKTERCIFKLFTWLV